MLYGGDYYIKAEQILKLKNWLYVLGRAVKVNKNFCASVHEFSSHTLLFSSRDSEHNPVIKIRMVNTTIYDKPSELKVDTYVCITRNFLPIRYQKKVTQQYLYAWILFDNLQIWQKDKSRHKMTLKKSLIVVHTFICMHVSWRSSSK